MGSTASSNKRSGKPRTNSKAANATTEADVNPTANNIATVAKANEKQIIDEFRLDIHCWGQWRIANIQQLSPPQYRFKMDNTLHPVWMYFCEPQPKSIEPDTKYTFMVDRIKTNCKFQPLYTYSTQCTPCKSIAPFTFIKEVDAHYHEGTIFVYNAADGDFAYNVQTATWCKVTTDTKGVNHDRQVFTFKSPNLRNMATSRTQSQRVYGNEPARSKLIHVPALNMWCRISTPPNKSRPLNISYEPEDKKLGSRYPLIGALDLHWQTVGCVESVSFVLVRDRFLVIFDWSKKRCYCLHLEQKRTVKTKKWITIQEQIVCAVYEPSNDEIYLFPLNGNVCLTMKAQSVLPSEFFGEHLLYGYVRECQRDAEYLMERCIYEIIESYVGETAIQYEYMNVGLVDLLSHYSK